ncbi:MAG: hypothetical protein C1O27_000644 [Chloroflexi bacterium]|nr:MAG: hypothetical protein C1O27_000644 [Chloroflexota bacterium]
MRILLIGDVVGKPGRRAVKALLPGLRREYNMDLVVANGENLAAGFGLTRDTMEEMLDAGVDVVTAGNHVWDNKEIIPHMNEEIPLIRPLNFPPGTPGRGTIGAKGALIVNLMGRVFMGTLDDPFRAMEEVLAETRAKIILVDFHGEATSEKNALGWYLDGRVSALVGTHTHVATADARILPKGTAMCTDAGMTGPINSIIGSEPEDVLARFTTQMPRRLRIAEGPVQFNSVLVDVDDTTGMAREIFRIDRNME